jgi:hypothetical protein
VFPLPELSAVVVPLPSLKANAATGPLDWADVRRISTGSSASTPIADTINTRRHHVRADGFISILL